MKNAMAVGIILNAVVLSVIAYQQNLQNAEQGSQALTLLEKFDAREAERLKAEQEPEENPLAEKIDKLVGAVERLKQGGEEVAKNQADQTRQVLSLLASVEQWDVEKRKADRLEENRQARLINKVITLLERAEQRALRATPSSRPVKIGILHSLSGTMAISEASLRDAVLMAVEEINAAGGVLGKNIEAVVVDPASNWPLFAEKAKELINTHKVAVTFGCWTSVSRKTCLPVFEEYNQLLFYPVQYEGEEQSRNVFYTAATPNQQLVPAANYLMGQGFRKFYLLGTDYVFPRTANKVLKAFLKAKGVPDENVREEYTSFHHQDYQTIVGRVKEFAAGGDACILSTINGDSNVPFYKEFANQGLTPADCPIMAFSVAEDELRFMDVRPLVGHLAAWNYFQSIDTPANAAFVKNFKAYCEKKGLPDGAKRVTDDSIEAAYFGVYVWKAAVEKAGSFDVDKVRKAVYGLEFDAPGGKKQMHPNNQHTLKPVYIGEILEDGQFKIVTKLRGLVSPDSYSSYLHPDGNYPAPTGGSKK